MKRTNSRLARTVAAASVAAGAFSLAPAAWGATPDTTPPTAPTNLRQIGMSNGDPILGWDAATDDTGVLRYRLLQDGNSVRLTPSRSPSPKFYLYVLVYCTALPGQTHTFTVQAIDTSGNSGAPSNAVVVTL